MIRSAPDHHLKAILFDLDGVLVDAADWHKDAFNKAMWRLDAKPLTDKEHNEIYNGLSTRKKLEMLTADGRFDQGWIVQPDFIDLFYKEKQKFTIETIKEKCVPNQRVINTLQYAHIKGYDLAVVTNCSRHTCELMLNLSGLDGFFEFIISNEDVDGQIKPSPRPYLEATWRLGLKQKEALAVDDTWKGINSALGAFCRTWHLKKFEELTVSNLKKRLDACRYPI